MTKKIQNILVTGAKGQIGSELTVALRKKYGAQKVIATDLKADLDDNKKKSEPFYVVDVCSYESIKKVVTKHNIDTIVHMAAILSGVGEKNPALAWDVNMNGTINILNIAREHKMVQVFVPSSIAVFGQGTPLENTPNDTVLQPSTMYGVTKVCGELLCDYYVNNYNLDVRGLRYPGIISAETLPGGGTTDYSVAIYYEAIKQKKYTCFVSEGTRLPMMYMPDCIKATMDLMAAAPDKLKHHSNFNVGAMSFDVKTLANEIKKHIPEFKVDYVPDFRQAIADSWPASVDDSYARKEWGWSPSWDLSSMTKDILKKLGKRHAEGKL